MSILILILLIHSCTRPTFKQCIYALNSPTYIVHNAYVRSPRKQDNNQQHSLLELYTRVYVEDVDVDEAEALCEKAIPDAPVMYIIPETLISSNFQNLLQRQQHDITISKDTDINRINNSGFSTTIPSPPKQDNNRQHDHLEPCTRNVCVQFLADPDPTSDQLRDFGRKCTDHGIP